MTFKYCARSLYFHLLLYIIIFITRILFWAYLQLFTQILRVNFLTLVTFCILQVTKPPFLSPYQEKQ